MRAMSESDEKRANNDDRSRQNNRQQDNARLLAPGSRMEDQRDREQSDQTQQYSISVLRWQFYQKSGFGVSPKY